MKKLVTISLFIFWAITAAILTAGLVFYQNNKNNTPALNNFGSKNFLGYPAVGASATLNLAEVAKHSSISDCWMIINSKVYNVSSFLSIHPGGAGSMTPYCGQEASRAFATKDKNSSHSSYADSLLVNYLVGNLNQVITQEQIQQTTRKINSTAPSSQGRGNNGFDD